MYYRRLKFCIIYLVLNRGYFEAVLMKNTPRTLGVNVGRAILWLINDNTLAWAIEGDDFSFIDFWGSLLG
jgi:hypothetical protein